MASCLRAQRGDAPYLCHQLEWPAYRSSCLTSSLECTLEAHDRSRRHLECTLEAHTIDLGAISSALSKHTIDLGAISSALSKHTIDLGAKRLRHARPRGEARSESVDEDSADLSP